VKDVDIPCLWLYFHVDLKRALRYNGIADRGKSPERREETKSLNPTEIAVAKAETLARVKILHDLLEMFAAGKTQQEIIEWAKALIAAE
jgi:hypothetical protein